MKKKAKEPRGKERNNTPNDETEPNDAQERDQKRRKLQLLMSEKRLLLRVSHVKSFEPNRLNINSMLNGIEFKQQRRNKADMDISNIIGALSSTEEKTPHDEENEMWKSVYQGVKFLDDMNGYKELDKNQVIAARRLEIEYFRKWVFTRM